MSLFQFKDSKSYLRYYIAHLPKKGRGEISRMAHHLRVSTTLVSQVLSGEKFFTAEQALILTQYLGLIGVEADFFTYLIQAERAGSKDLKLYWNNKLKDIREQSLKISSRVAVDQTLKEEDRAVFYSTPLYSAIRLFTSVEQKGKSLDEICNRFELSRSKASLMLKFLIEKNLCVEKNNRYHIGAQRTHLEQGSPHLLRHHSNWRIRAIRQSEDLTDQELMYTAPVSLSRKDFEGLREEMALFIKSFLDRVHASPAEDIACFNLDFFWIKK